MAKFKSILLYLALALIILSFLTGCTLSMKIVPSGGGRFVVKKAPVNKSIVKKESKEKSVEKAKSEATNQETNTSDKESKEKSVEKTTSKATNQKTNTSDQKNNNIKSTDTKAVQATSGKKEEKINNSKDKSAEKIISGVIKVVKNNIYIVVPEKNIQYNLVGLKKEEKEQLIKLKGKSVSMKLRVLTTKSSKAYNAQFISIMEEIVSEQELTKDKTEKSNKKSEIVKKDDQTKEAHGTTKKDITNTEKMNKKIVAKNKVGPEDSNKSGEKKAQNEKNHRIFMGKIFITHNTYFIIDVKNEVRYRLVNLNKQQIRMLLRLNRQDIKVEIKIVSKQVNKLYNAKLVRIFKN